MPVRQPIQPGLRPAKAPKASPEAPPEKTSPKTKPKAKLSKPQVEAMVDSASASGFEKQNKGDRPEPRIIETNSSPRRHTFFISTARNLEMLLVQELADMGINGAEPMAMGVEIPLSQEEVYRVVYNSRIGSKVMRPIATFPCRNADELYEQAYSWNWSAIMKPDQTLKVTASVWDSSITHSQFAALKLKDAVVDALRDQHGIRPSVDRENPDIRLDLHLRKDQAKVSLYYSDGVMHRRGYRKQAVDAPMKENLAAAILRFAGWKPELRLIDPFCGSGTFLIEAAMIATRTPAGFFRKTQGFETLPDFDADLWDKVKSELDGARVELPLGLIQGSDIDARALAATRANLESTPFTGRIKLTQKDFARLEGPYKDAVMVANPPYGVRLEDTDQGLGELYGKIGRFIQDKCPGIPCLVLCPTPELSEVVGLPVQRKLVIDNGALEVAACEYAADSG